MKIFVKKQLLIYYGLFFVLLLLLWPLALRPLLGFIFLILIYYIFFSHFKLLADNFKKEIRTSAAHLLTFAYLTLSLSFVYYFVGWKTYILFLWLALSLAVLYFLAPGVIYDFNQFKKIKNIKFSWDDYFSLFLVIFIGANLYFNPIINGSPTPWLNVPASIWVAFIILTFLRFQKALKGGTVLLDWLYLLLLISVVAIKYPLPFGYDALLHQASLNYIAVYGQITPLSPFYIGEYALINLVHFFTDWPIGQIDRFFLPFIFSILSAIFYSFLEKKNWAWLALGTLLMIPSQFYNTSPHAYALIWGMGSVVLLYKYFKTNEKSLWHLSLVSNITAIMIHPLTSLVILPWTVMAPAWKKKQRWLMIVINFLTTALLLIGAFVAYNWLGHKVVTLTDPLYNYRRFFDLFTDPIWYDRTVYSFGLWLLYGYEKIQIFLLFVLIYFWKRKRGLAEKYIFYISLSAYFAAWIFISGIDISGYTETDAYNYAYRIAQLGKWLIWPLFITCLITYFGKVSWQRPKRILVLSALTLLAVSSWYLTYPRNDLISRININNVRAEDYQVIDYIYKEENGKTGYLVLANQLFGGLAVLKYSYGPYYQSRWGEMMYYSIPMSSEMNKRYEEIMNTKEFDPQKIFELMEETGQKRSYFIETDYWPLAENVAKEMKEKSNKYTEIAGSKIYQFVLPE
jgi:hypothetical protein